ncbi:MAG: hypothetical protein M3Z08_19560 [Chloroflexota bacterium]|nr:hypothetical protein [Chloroflexota bacterium]
MEADRLVDWLLEQEPSLTLQWLHEMLEGTRPLPEGFNWHGLAECATFNTFRKVPLSSPPHLAWARVAALAYNYVIYENKHSARLAHNPDMKKMSYLSLEEALMTLQARCIIAFGSVAGDPVLDIQHPITCFFEDLPFSPDEVLKIYAQEGKEHATIDHVHTSLSVRDALIASLEQFLPFSRAEDSSFFPFSSASASLEETNDSSLS